MFVKAQWRESRKKRTKGASEYNSVTIVYIEKLKGAESKKKVLHDHKDD